MTLRIDQPRLLWYDGTNRPLKEKILAAIRYYEEKYNVKATDVLVNPAQFKLEDCPTKVNKIGVSTSKYVKPDYMSVGFKDFDDFKR